MDRTFLTGWIFDYENYHSITWLNADEILAVENWLIKYQDNAWPEKQWGYLLGNSWGGISAYPNDKPKDIDDVRFIIGFDS